MELIAFFFLLPSSGLAPVLGAGWIRPGRHRLRFPAASAVYRGSDGHYAAPSVIALPECRQRPSPGAQMTERRS